MYTLTRAPDSTTIIIPMRNGHKRLRLGSGFNGSIDEPSQPSGVCGIW